MKRIFVLEDDIACAVLIIATLKHLAPTALVVHAESIAQAKSLLITEDRETPLFGLAILDFNVPDGNGTELVGLIRERFPGCSVCMHSGQIPWDLAAMTEMQRVAPDEMLAKPAKMDDYRKILRRAGM
ncbi:MAG: hypothetical protein Greene041679_290 [Parcubacteria group bacterium Greene0416_79]|nr:MAG: hypothetical protein Greene041679_290 [Parcubacteria group bacterium Greene0416_79]